MHEEPGVDGEEVEWSAADAKLVDIYGLLLVQRSLHYLQVTW
jgi:hypothetical protein